MKQKMSRASGVDCAAAAFANGRGPSCSPASRFYELAVGRAVVRPAAFANGRGLSWSKNF